MKMYKGSKLAALLAAVLLVLTLCACGSGDSKASGSGNASNANGFGELNQETAGQSESLWNQDIELLRGYGYTSSFTRESLYLFEGVINAEKNSIEAIVTATNTAEEKVIIIYYLKTEKAAESCIGTLNQAYKQVGRRIVHGDQDNLIHN